jgi:gluconolactonase
MQPNGIVGTPDGKFLYVADIRASKTYKYQISEDGTLSKPPAFRVAGFRRYDP